MGSQEPGDDDDVSNELGVAGVEEEITDDNGNGNDMMVVAMLQKK